MRIYDLIAKKRNGGTHSREELEAIVNGFVRGEVADYQMAAWMMAVYLRGMTDEETAELTDVMAHSGVMVDLSPIPGIKVDKHSAGGIGSITGSVLGSFLYVACSEWWLRFLDNPTMIGTFKVPLLGHGFRMVVFSVVIMVIVLFYRQGLMGTKEFSWDAIFAFFGKIGRFFKNLFTGQKAVKGGAANE